MNIVEYLYALLFAYIVSVFYLFIIVYFIFYRKLLFTVNEAVLLPKSEQKYIRILRKLMALSFSAIIVLESCNI